ncbi:hypothetical protein CDG77_28200 [Nostoc sp. 'Peltigera membranacea cyanobiont' 213]|uniref:WYL domain-containing protein n=1 Tax=Nostoc sp. 'Peltigera membranacea cyanobiont' 213 TaxID=2014530 RepID=UPI000B951572|nr:WYL domain-containing protein [Nostoc sp. 'Peltigera membranacea cyanobiont' 213]OYD87644.1 hypothetical protein CDG77_28200 [Nostoc sp. 'Peltigera membranacea cyanobiont' 213]
MTRKKNSGDNFGFQKPKNIKGIEKPKKNFLPKTPLPNTKVSEPPLLNTKVLEVLELIKQAITQKNLIRFYYQDFQRIAEPYILGLKDGVLQVLVYQVGGQSSSGELPDLRRMNLENMLHLQILDETFSSNPPSLSGNHSSWDEILATVS